ncbi:MAG: CcmD family protein [Fimbriimonadales bacterium]
MNWQTALSISILIVWAGIFAYLLWLQGRMAKLQKRLQELERQAQQGD